MTREEQNIADDKMRADIALALEQAGLALAQASKTRAETAKIKTEDRWYLLVVGSGATLAIVAIAKLFL